MCARQSGSCAGVWEGGWTDVGDRMLVFLSLMNGCHSESCLLHTMPVQCFCVRVWCSSKDAPLASTAPAIPTLTLSMFPSAAGMVHLPRKGTVMVYIHRNVPFVQVDMFTPWKLQQILLRQFPKSKVGWYSVPEAALWELTVERLRSLNATS